MTYDWVKGSELEANAKQASLVSLKPLRDRLARPVPDLDKVFDTLESKMIQRQDHRVRDLLIYVLEPLAKKICELPQDIAAPMQMMVFE
jgi:hypothetical protein